MSDNEYRAEDVSAVQWPTLSKLPNGRWQRVWRVTFESDIEPATVEAPALLASLTDDGFDVAIVYINARSIDVTVTTEEWGWADRYYMPTYRMLRSIEDCLGAIATIHHQPKTAWLPWRFPETIRGAG